MEIIVSLVVIAVLGFAWYYNSQKKNQTVNTVEDAPYKVDAPSPVIETPVSEIVPVVEPAPVVEQPKVEPAKKTTGTKKAPAKAKTPAKPKAAKAPAKTKKAKTNPAA